MSIKAAHAKLLVATSLLLAGSASARDAHLRVIRNYLRTIGGNESDAVGMKEVRLDVNGLVKNPAGLYISVIETML